MDESYPILIDGRSAGTLRVRRGLLTEFDARCDDPGRLLRLSVYGGGREGYLGVMEPAGDGLRLCRRLSRAAMAGFPETVEYAAESGQKPPEAEDEPAKPTDGPSSPADESPEPADGPPKEPAAADTPLPEPETDVLWYQAGDGTLFTVHGGVHYRAIPVTAWGLPPESAAERRVIDGAEYAVFALKDNRVI